MVVQHNLTAINANRYFGINNNKLSKSLEKLSSGYAINRAGDNAAGLAVSEKMRAQISGLTQASKNAEDGISMTQTFEGALTETDSILQRMRSLAVQSANGSYDNSVDRAAIQLEYDQLNDELDQIADTDFNGVVVLNGGTMADGLKAVNGTFDYSATVTRDAKQLSSTEIQTVDYKGFSTTNANTAWGEWSADAYDRTDADKTNDGAASTDITFKYSATDGTWSAVSATGGMDVDAINACVDNASKNGTSTANNGGFALTDGTNEVANVVMDTSKLVDGDTITLTFTNPLAKNSAPENIGVSSVTSTGITADGYDENALTITLTDDISSTNNSTTTELTEDEAELFNQLNGATLKVTYASGVAAATGYELTLANGDVVTSAAKATGTSFTLGSTNFYLGGTASTAGGDAVVQIASKADGTGTVYATFTATSPVATGGSGSASYTLSVAESTYTDAGDPTVAVKNPANSDTGVSISNSNNKSTAKLTYTDNIVLQVGARTKDSVNFTLAYESDGIGDLKDDLNCTASGLGTDKLSLATQEDANSAIDQIDNAINKVSMVRGTFGALQNRLEHKIDNLDTNNENLTAAESRIRDTDMAEEMMNFTKNQILSQASQSMLAQANQLPQGVLSLLQ